METKKQTYGKPNRNETKKKKKQPKGNAKTT